MAGVVLGVGSPEGGDRLGWMVVERLTAQGEGRARLEALDRPGPALVTAVVDADFAVIVDAVRSPAHAGPLHRLTTTEQLTEPSPTSTHGFGVAEALALGERLDQLPPWVVIGVAIPDGSLPGEAVLAEAVEAVQREVVAFSAGSAGGVRG
ncbi:hydrogenase maturation protease [Thiohalorhabdus sp.]|uniref:hydrogenase maturation protease n=1 Tax=Thiohalorhabdus sp. TaxID=3094134 RepID=UPI003FCDB905